MVERKPRYRHTWLKASRDKTGLRCGVVATSPVSSNKPHPQFLIFFFHHKVSTYSWWTPHASEHSTEKGAGKFALTKKSLSAPHQRAIFWVPWLLAYTGLRVSEATQFQGRHLRRENGVAFMLITPEDGSTKSGKAWTMAIHPHLIELGLLDMFFAIGDGPAFYTAYPPGTDLRALEDHRAGESANKIADWITGDLGVAAPGGKPNHAWRHTFTTMSRTHKLDKETRDYMMGSRSTTDAREGYGDWPPEVIDEEIRKLPRFDVMETDWRPTLEKVRPEPIKNSAKSQKAHRPTLRLRRPRTVKERL